MNYHNTLKRTILTVFIATGINLTGQNKPAINLITIDENQEKVNIQGPGVKVEVDELSDTITKITLGHKRFEIIESNDRVQVRMVNTPRDQFKGHFAGFDLGFNNLVTSDFSSSLPANQKYMELNSGKSMHVGINFMQYSIGLQKHQHHIGLVTGASLNFNNYRFDNQFLLTRDAATGMVAGVPSLRNIEKNKLTTAFINIPLLLEFQVPSSSNRLFYFAVGGYCGFKTGSHTKVVYDDGNGRDKEKDRGNLNIRPFQYGVTARMGYRFIKLYANYNYSTLFEENKGPDVYPFTVGLTLITI